MIDNSTISAILYLLGRYPKKEGKMNKCPMCGKDTNKTVKRYFQYDNGQTFINWVCESCSDLHRQMLVRQANEILKAVK
jgi:hypothetical protein